MRGRRAKSDVSMFPFLSVLCCIIGVLMLLMMVVLSTRVMEAQEQAPPPPPPRPEAQGEQDDAIDEKNYHEIMRELDRLGGQLVERRNQREVLQRKIEQLDELLETKLTELLVPDDAGRRKGTKLGEPVPVQVVPALGHRPRKRPIPVEVSAEGYRVHPEKVLYPPIEPVEPFNADFGLKRFLTKVDQNRQNEYLLLLIHPNGVTAYEGLRKHLTKHYSERVTLGEFIVTKSRIDCGAEPFSEEWLLLAQ